MKPIAFFVLTCFFGILLKVVFFNNQVSKYEPLAVIEMDLDDMQGTYQSSFKNYYNGTHAISFSTESPPPIGEGYVQTAIDVVLNVKPESGHVYLSENIENHISPYWKESEGGVDLFLYEAPEDLPIGKDLVMEISLGEKSKAFIEKYRFDKIMILKHSDK